MKKNKKPAEMVGSIVFMPGLKKNLGIKIRLTELIEKKDGLYFRFVFVSVPYNDTKSRLIKIEEVL